MDGIPPTRDSDSEDVIWALETAESLWKRQARVDAIVWLRRAAQAAADSGDGDRAATLTRDAALLTETFGHTSSSMRSASPVGADESDDIDALLDATEELDDADLISSPPPTPLAASDYPPPAVSSTKAPPRPPPRRPLPPVHPPPVPSSPPPAPRSPAEATSVVPPPAESVPAPALPPPRPLELSLPPESDVFARELDSAPADRFEPPTKLSAETLPAFAVPGVEAMRSDMPPPPRPSEAPGAPAVTTMGPGALSPLDLTNLEALANVSEDQREELAASASVILCAEGVVVGSFVLALVLEGAVTVSTLDARVIAHIGQRTLIHTRGTMDVATPLRVSVRSDDTTLALWNEAALADALATSPWVEEDLAAEGDRLQAWAQVAASPLARRLHDDVRLRLYEKLAVKALPSGTELVGEGAPVVGLFLVGGGSIVVAGDVSRELTPGEFVFPEAALSAARASSRAVAGAAGAIVLVADRKTTQELCSTEPLLLEILAGM